MTSQFLSHLRTELAGLKDAGLYKAERVITSKQAGEIAIASGERAAPAVAAVSIRPQRQ